MLRTRFSTLLCRRMQAPYRPLLFMFSAAEGHPKRCRSQIRTEISFCSGNRSVPVHSHMKGFETASPRAGRGEKRRTQSGRSEGSRCPPSQFIARICRFSGPRGTFPAKPWIRAGVSGIFDSGDDAFHVRPLDEMARLGWNTGFIAELRSAELRQRYAGRRDNYRPYRRGNCWCAGRGRQR